MERKRYNIETALAYGPVKLQGEYGNANFSGTNAAGVSYDKDMNAYYVSASWMLTGEKYADSFKGGKFDRITPKNNFNPDFSNLGAFELGIRYSEFDADDFKLSAASVASTPLLNAGRTNKADSTVLGIKWIPDPNARFLVNYIHTDYDTAVLLGAGKTMEKEKAIIMRAQYDF